MGQSAWNSLTCARAGCEQPATHVVVQATDMTLLFRDGAGVVCEKDANELEQVGGFALSLQEFARAKERVESVDDDDWLPLLSGRPIIGHCSECGEAREDEYTCRQGGHTVLLASSDG